MAARWRPGRHCSIRAQGAAVQHRAGQQGLRSDSRAVGPAPSLLRPAAGRAHRRGAITQPPWAFTGSSWAGSFEGSKPRTRGVSGGRCAGGGGATFCWRGREGHYARSRWVAPTVPGANARDHHPSAVVPVAAGWPTPMDMVAPMAPARLGADQGPGCRQSPVRAFRLNCTAVSIRTARTASEAGSDAGVRTVRAPLGLIHAS